MVDCGGQTSPSSLPTRDAGDFRSGILVTDRVCANEDKRDAAAAATAGADSAGNKHDGDTGEHGDVCDVKRRTSPTSELGVSVIIGTGEEAVEFVVEDPKEKSGFNVDSRKGSRTGAGCSSAPSLTPVPNREQTCIFPSPPSVSSTSFAGELLSKAVARRRGVFTASAAAGLPASERPGGLAACSSVSKSLASPPRPARWSRACWRCFHRS